MALEMWLLTIVSCATVLVIAAFLILIGIYLSTNPYPDRIPFFTEECYIDPDTSNFIKLPRGLNERPELELTVVVPAYNECERLPSMLNETIDYLEKRKNTDSKFSYEVIIVDDGSVDHTSEVALKYSKAYGVEKVRLIKLPRNKGKGAAVRCGILCARGRKLLFADADGATRFPDVEKLEEALGSLIASRWNGGMAIICGSRAHLEKEVVVKRSVLRNVLMYGFKFCVWFLCVRGVRDTQCGFKLFSRSAARVLFHNLHVERWAFDVDLLYLAQHFNMPVVEVPVQWHEVGGSKLVPIFSWLQMAKDLLLIRLRYGLGAWKIEPHYA